MVLGSFSMALIREDFPTFGRPTMASLEGTSRRSVGRSRGWQVFFDRFDKLGYTAAMSCADRNDRIEPKLAEFGILGGLLDMVNLVHGDNHRLSSRSKFLGYNLIEWSYAFAAVADQYDDLRHIHSKICFRPGPGRQRRRRTRCRCHRYRSP